MSESLLAHLYTRIKGSQEDVATISLQYIVNQSTELNNAFTKLLFTSLQKDQEQQLHYVCQAVGEEKERPDIAGISATGQEVLLCEVKFYAGLTSNQPTVYLDRLIKENGVGLVFICPSARKITLWSRLLDLCELRDIQTVQEFCISVDGMNMSIVTWSEVLDTLRKTAAAVSVQSLSDIDQLEGYCRMMDSEAFIPFAPEDLGPENARKEDRYYQVLDEVFKQLIANKALCSNAKGLRAASFRSGYVRYIRVKGYSLSIIFDRNLWLDQSTVETPFWVEIADKDFKQPETYKKAFIKYPESWKTIMFNKTRVALFALPNATLDEVAASLISQILKYIQDIE